MYHLILNTKIFKEYHNFTIKELEYVHTLLKLSELEINPSQIETQRYDISSFISLDETYFNKILQYSDSMDVEVGRNVYYHFMSSEAFLTSDDSNGNSKIIAFFITFMDFKGNIKKVFVPHSFLFNEKNYKKLWDCKKSRSMTYNPPRNTILKSIYHRYNLTTSNVIFTNEINKDTTINFIQDKNYMIKLNSNYESTSLSKNNFVINPNIYREYMNNSSLLPLEHLFELFNVDRKKLKKSLEMISYIPNKFIVLGMGGTMGNFFYWIKQFQEYFNLPYVFKKLVIFENDRMEFHNIFRIPLLMEDTKQNYYKSQSKINVFLNNCTNITLDVKIHHRFLNTTSHEFYKLKGTSIFLGTPDIPTRQSLSQLNLKFFCPTHQNNTIKIVETPTIEGSLFYETYGSIDLNKFLLNMFNMSVNLVYVLAENTKLPLEKNKLHFQQSFNEINFIENSKKSKILKNIAYTIN